MAINRNDIKRVEKLAKLNLPEEKVDDFAIRLSRVFDWIDQLKEVNIDDVGPMANPLIDIQDQTSDLREDKVTEGNNAEDVLKNAPNAQHNSFVVPKVVE